MKRSACVTALGAWALAFGCSVGWGSFVMPGTTFLPVAGPLGTALGLGIGALVMLILAANYHFLMNRYPDEGGTYTYTKICFGYDHGFLSAWFLLLTYIAIIWANATALPLIARVLLGSAFQFGFDYTIAGFHVYMGEILLAVGALVIAALICLRRAASLRVQIGMSLLLMAGIVICFVAAAGKMGAEGGTMAPAFAAEDGGLSGTLTIFALVPWAFVGFESICHSAAEAKFSLKKTFLILAFAILAAGAAYILLSLLAVTARPEGEDSWLTYIRHLGGYAGLSSQPTFFAADAALGGTGQAVLGAAALCAIFTGLIGNYIALSRLLCAMAGDGMIPGWIGELDAHQVPRKAILCIMGISVILPFFGRTAISWIVDVTTVGATIAYAFAAAAALKTARQENNRLHMGLGAAGLIVSVLFALEFLIPNLLSVKTLSTESYLILAAWGILGFAVFRVLLHRDRQRRMGRSIVAWIVLLALIIFTSSVWMRQTTETSLEHSAVRLAEVAGAREAEESGTVAGVVEAELDQVESALGASSLIQIGLIVLSLAILLEIYAFMQKRERQVEVEKALAEESSRAKTSFLSNMSHEIRTPMNAIIGLDNIALRDPDLTPRTREHLEKIGASAQHLLGLINDILDMSRIESGRMVLKNEEFSFREFLNQISIIINGQCQDKGLRYECHLVGRVRDYYVGDDMKLKQVMINILGNAVKFTNAPGDVTLTVQETEERDGRCLLRFVMKDTGIGMDPDFIPKIFEAFSQEDATATNRYGGSGLGMAITRNFVEMMGGDIQVESEKGVGSVFTVTVPLEPSARIAHEEHGIRLPEGLRAMVVDDDSISLEHTRLVLESIGIAVDTAESALAGLDRIRGAWDRGEAYALVLTDYRMPGMNGLEMIRKIRRFDRGETAIILLTGYNWDIIEEDAQQEGVDDIVSKPLFPEVLIRNIYAVLARKQGVELMEAETPMEESEIGRILNGRRVLMAEDVEQNAEILADLLDLEEILAEHAENGRVALEMFRDHPEGYYDAILMDVRMPEMDGLAATRAIRALDRPDAGRIPIIAMTANVFDEDVQRSLEAGMNAHLSKPIEPEKLYETMARLMRGSEQTEST